jgi:hypothetical protein
MISSNINPLTGQPNRLLVGGAIKERQRIADEIASRATRGPMDPVGSGDLGSFAAFQTQFGLNKPTFKPPGGGGGLTGDQIDEIERQTKAYDKLLLSARQQVEANNMQAQALGMTAEQAARLTYEQELLNKAANDNIKLSPAMRNELMATAQAMAESEERTRKLTEAYDFGKQVFGSFFSDLKTELMNGTSLWTSFAKAATNALGSIADKALGMAADGIFDLVFGAITSGLGGGGGTWGVAGGFAGFEGQFGLQSFAGGGYTGSGSRSGGLDGQGGRYAIVHPNETVIDHTKQGGTGAANDNVQLNVFVNGAVGGDDMEERAYRGAQRALDEYRRYGVHDDVETHLNDRHARG